MNESYSTRAHSLAVCFISGMGPLDRGAAQRHRLPNGFRMNLLLEVPDPEPRMNFALFIIFLSLRYFVMIKF